MFKMAQEKRQLGDKAKAAVKQMVAEKLTTLVEELLEDTQHAVAQTTEQSPLFPSNLRGAINIRSIP